MIVADFVTDAPSLQFFNTVTALIGSAPKMVFPLPNALKSRPSISNNAGRCVNNVVGMLAPTTTLPPFITQCTLPKVAVKLWVVELPKVNVHPSYKTFDPLFPADVRDNSTAPVEFSVNEQFFMWVYEDMDWSTLIFPDELNVIL